MNNLYIPSSSSSDIVVLSGCYESRDFEIVTFRGHPNAYVSFPEGRYMEDENDVEDEAHELVHGGFTYLGHRSSGRLMLGWSYNHYGDFNANSPNLGGEKWTLPSILAEVISAIDGLNSIY